MASTWLSKDTSKSYYGKEVYVSSSGKITPVGSVGVLPSGNTFNIKETSPAVQAQLSGKQPAITSTEKYYLETEGKKVEVSKALQQKVIADQKAQQQAASTPRPTYAITAQGVAYADTGQLVSDVRQQQFRSNAYQFLAPAERFIAQRAGSQERVYQTVVKPKQWLTSQAEYWNQQYWKTGSFSARGKSLLAEAGSGAFGLISAPVETVGAVLITKKIPVGTISTQQAVAATTLISIGRSPKDPARGLARTTGEAAVVIPLSIGISKLQPVSQPKLSKSQSRIDIIKAEDFTVKRSISIKQYSIGKDIATTKSVTYSRVSGTETPSNILYESGQGKFTVTGPSGTKLAGTAKILSTYQPSPHSPRITYGLTEVDYKITGLSGAKSLYGRFGEVSYTKAVSTPSGLSDYYVARGLRTIQAKSAVKTPFLSGSIMDSKLKEISVGISKGYIQSETSFAGQAATKTTYMTAEIGKFSPFSTEPIRVTGVGKIPNLVKTGFKTGTGLKKVMGLDTIAVNEAELVSKAAESTLSSVIPKTGVSTSISPVLALGVSKATLESPSVLPEVTGSQVKTPAITGSSRITSPLPKLNIEQPRQQTRSESLTPVRQSVIPKGITPSYQGSLRMISPSRQTGIGISSVTTSVQQIPQIKQQVIPIQQPRIEASQVKIGQPQYPVQLIDTIPKYEQVLKQPEVTIIPAIRSPTSGSYTFSRAPSPGVGKISLPFSEFGGRSGPTKPVRFKPKYFASIEASVFNIKGKPTKFAIVSGLGIRPIAVYRR